MNYPCDREGPRLIPWSELTPLGEIWSWNMKVARFPGDLHRQAALDPKLTTGCQMTNQGLLKRPRITFTNSNCCQ